MSTNTLGTVIATVFVVFAVLILFGVVQSPYN